MKIVGALIGCWHYIILESRNESRHPRAMGPAFLAKPVAEFPLLDSPEREYRGHREKRPAPEFRDRASIGDILDLRD
jgi:hypothetical protein